MATYGYARVSSKSQNLLRQIEALRQFGIPHSAIYADKTSGKDFDRPAYQALLAILKKGDLLVVGSIDRFGRNYQEIIEQWKYVTYVKQAAIKILDMPLLDTREQNDSLTSVFIADLVLQILSYAAQNERENIRKRQADGIRAAKARGVHFGRPPMIPPHNFEEVARRYSRQEISRRTAGKLCNVSPQTFEKWYQATSSRCAP